MNFKFFLSELLQAEWAFVPELFQQSKEMSVVNLKLLIFITSWAFVILESLFAF